MAFVQESLAPTFLKSTTSYVCYKLTDFDTYVISKFSFDNGNKFSVIASGKCMKTPELAWENSDTPDNIPKHKIYIFVRNTG